MKHPADQELLSSAAVEPDAVEAHVAWCTRCRARRRHLLSELERSRQPQSAKSRQYRAAAGALAAVALLAISVPADEPANALPRPDLTPGASRTFTRAASCAHGTGAPVPAKVAAAVFQRYGIPDPTPGSYKVDRLIPPELGGTDDPRNLWPQPFRHGRWTSGAKDALEERLRTLVCSGALDLRSAQQEIASNWIASYRKHFQDDAPRAAR